MDKSILKKLDSIESLLISLNDKLDHFLGLEIISDEEKQEIAAIRKEVEAGHFDTFDSVFGD
jgi:hypothetical protein